MEHSELKLLNDAMYALGYDMSEHEDLVTLKEELNKLSQTVDKMLSLTEKEYVDVVAEFDKTEYSCMYSNR